ncbi:hypothetical protein QQS21_011552 [Conoideocrella luteorostrata]|uniref:Uncharacterized protein n=1 Tax=Conoideocrella luteorostrata TaxID=1105319 RepID=A0AAJ0CD54_9HYPO|nr:hypothetical protein QQS21_011552 [Conoideocrella luteorostrata]
MTLKVHSDFISRQTALLSLAPTTRYSSIHMCPPALVTKLTVPPFFGQDQIKTFHESIGPQAIHICRFADPVRTCILSQDWQIHREESLSTTMRAYGEYMFYFEFDKLDSRRNTIRFMLIPYLNEMSWRDSIRSDGVRWMFDSLGHYDCWSFSQLFKIFRDLRREDERKDVAIFLACFDSCDEEEQTWFLKAVLEEHSRTDLDYNLTIASSNPDNFLQESIPESQVLFVKDFPTAPTGFAIDEMGVHAGGLASLLEDVLRRRPVLSGLKQALENLIEEYHHTRTLSGLSNSRLA